MGWKSFLGTVQRLSRSFHRVRQDNMWKILWPFTLTLWQVMLNRAERQTCKTTVAINKIRPIIPK